MCVQCNDAKSCAGTHRCSCKNMRLIQLIKTRKLWKTILLSVTVIITIDCLSRIFQSREIPTEAVMFDSDIIDDYYIRRKDLNTSNLGTLLFKEKAFDPLQYRQSNRSFVVLIWKHYDWLKRRHLVKLPSGSYRDPLHGCSVHNCQFVGDDTQLATVDAVVVHIQKGAMPNSSRPLGQKWIFLSDEAPTNAFSLASGSSTRLVEKMVKLKFDWSMTYRSTSDIPVPYGRVIPLNEEELNKIDPIEKLIPHWKEKRIDVPAAVMMTNCKAFRMRYLEELKKHMEYDGYGACFQNTKICPGHFRKDCEALNQYLFYFAFENSLCSEYFTEKVFYNSYSKGAIPVIMGPSLEDCQKFLPPMSYIHVELTDNARTVAQRITAVANDIEKLLQYHHWRLHFKVVQEHGYFGSESRHYCRVCEALNYNEEPQFSQFYDEAKIRSFIDPTETCRVTKYLSGV